MLHEVSTCLLLLQSKGPVGINSGDKLAFNFPSHNAALQCFNISHRTQLAFQIRALTFSWRQAHWYLHNLDGLSLLSCPWPFVSNVHTDNDRLWVNFSHSRLQRLEEEELVGGWLAGSVRRNAVVTTQHRCKCCE